MIAVCKYWFLPPVTIPVPDYGKWVIFFYGTCEFQDQDIPFGPVLAAAPLGLPAVSGCPSGFYQQMQTSQS